MFIALGKLGELRLVVDIRFRNLKTTNPLGNVSFDINDTINFTEITSYRGGTSASEHVGNFKGDQSNTRLRRFAHLGDFRVGRSPTTNPGCGKPGNKQHRYKLFHQNHLSSQLTLHSSWLYIAAHGSTSLTNGLMVTIRLEKNNPHTSPVRNSAWRAAAPMSAWIHAATGPTGWLRNAKTSFVVANLQLSRSVFKACRCRSSDLFTSTGAARRIEKPVVAATPQQV